jgi:hypothetical protein
MIVTNVAAECIYIILVKPFYIVIEESIAALPHVRGFFVGNISCDDSLDINKANHPMI